MPKEERDWFREGMEERRQGAKHPSTAPTPLGGRETSYTRRSVPPQEMPEVSLWQMVVALGLAAVVAGAIIWVARG